MARAQLRALQEQSTRQQHRDDRFGLRGEPALGQVAAGPDGDLHVPAVHGRYALTGRPEKLVICERLANAPHLLDSLAFAWIARHRR
ncbi:hypothetical protein ACWGDX_11375 [Streptomyces sp. NPDC055025]